MKLKKIIILTLFILLNLSLFSQYSYWYYGKNKVMKQSFKWQYNETPHFKIYYYTSNKALIKKIAKAAEQSYNKISDYLNVKVKRKIPLIFFENHIDFEQTNIISYIPPGALAFADPTAFRVVVQGDSSFEELSRTIRHELGHIFEYTIMGPRSSLRNRPPLWLMEGFSEFITFHWDDFYLLTVRDSVLNDNIPLIEKNGDFKRGFYSGRIPYDFGHLIYEFIEKKFGRRGIRKMLFSLRGRSLLKGSKNPLKVFGYSHKIFNYEFKKYLRERFKKYVLKENPEDYSFIIGPDFPYVYSFSHEISPSGELLAVLTVNIKNYKLDLILISVKDGKVIKNITPGFTSKYDGINFKFDPSKGKSFSWNNNSDKIAFFARKELDNYLVLINILNGKILKKIKIENIEDPSSPDFHPDNKTILFTGLEKSKSYIYSINTENGEIRKLTNGYFFVRSLNISSEGNKIVFSAKTEQTSPFYKIYLGTIKNPEYAKKITSGEFNDITPTFSDDSKHIYYSSNELGSFNINSINLEEKTLYRYTDVKTGNFFPIEIPEEKSKLIISSYYKGSFILFKKDTSEFLEKREIEFENIKNPELSTKESLTTSEFEIKETKKYKPLKKLYVKSTSPIVISMGSNGGFWGYSYLILSDLMGDHNFSLTLASQYGYKSYHLTYFNQKSRLQPFLHFFSYQDVYYYGYNYWDYLTTRKMYGGEIGFVYPFNRSYRFETTFSLYKQDEISDMIFYGLELPYGQYFSGTAAPLQFSLIGETTRFANYGPNMGHTFRLTYKKFIKFKSSYQDSYALEADLRKYIRIDNYTLLAFRMWGFKSGGKNPLIFWTGGDNTIRSVGWRNLIGNNGFTFNAELRFPLLHIAATPIGLIGPVRGVFFFDLGGVWFNGEKFRLFEKGEGLKLDDAISSYGFGVEWFMFGFPFHIEWVYKTNFKDKTYQGINFWIGFDF